MPVPLDEFARRLAASGLLSRDQVRGLLGEHRSAAGRTADTQSFARMLVRREMLTKYQAAEIYQGKTKGLVLGNYTILDRVGAGGMGQVYKALHRRMERVVALKVLPAEATKSPELVQRFHREVKAAARLEHPHIVTAYDADEAGGVHFLVMQFVDGKDLSQLLKANGPMSVAQAVECVKQAASGLAYAHHHGVIHRDIKPANLLLDREGSIKILDMGLARLEEQFTDQTAHELTRSGQIMGTVDYMSPEQAEETRVVDARTDIYSLGCTLYVLLAGRPMFAGATTIAKLMAHRTQPAPKLRAARADAPTALEAVFQKMVAKSPDDRYQSMDELLAEVATCLGAAAPVQLDGGSTSDSALTDFLKQMAGDEPIATRAKVQTKVAGETIAYQPAGEETGTEHGQQAGAAAAPPSKSIQKSKQPAADPRVARHRQNAARLAAPLLILGGGIASLLLLIAAAGGLLWLMRPHADSGPPAIARDGADRPSLPPPPPPSNFALQFDGAGSFVEIPSLKLDNSQPFTVEAILSPAAPEKGAQNAISNDSADARAGFGMGTKDDGKWSVGIYDKSDLEDGEGQRFAFSDRVAAAGARAHVAAVFDGARLVLFVDGVAQAAVGTTRAKPPESHLPLTLGANAQRSYCFAGVIDEVRISSSARYERDFEPPAPTARFAPDVHTLALYHCDEGTGDELQDSSGNNHHGKIVGAKWVKVGNPSPPPPPPTSPNPRLPNGWVFGEVENLGPRINTEGEDGGPFVSTDGLSLLWHSERSGGTGALDLWVATRESLTESFGAPKNLGPPINTDASESDPCLSADGLTLFFSSTREGGKGDDDVWMATRASTNDEFDAPVNLGPPVNSSDAESAPSLSSDSRELIFSSSRSGGHGGSDLWICTRKSAAETFGSPRNLGSTVNSGGEERSERLSADGLTLVFESYRSGNRGDDLYFCTRQARGGPFGAPINLGPAVNTEYNEGMPAFSPDGKWLYFNSDRPGGEGDWDLYRVAIALAPPLAVAPFDDATAKKRQQAWADYLGLPVEKEVDIGGGAKMTFRLIPPGEFMMGSTDDEQAKFNEEAEALEEGSTSVRIRAEGPQHRVRITQPFYIGKSEVTQAQWEAVMGGNPSKSVVHPMHPVENVSWNDVQPFMEKLNQSNAMKEMTCQLPTEAQWEFACRAGTSSYWYCGDNDEDLQQFGWFDANSNHVTHPVGQRRPNGFGLHDMHGNVYEWCVDWYSQNYYAQAPAYDPCNSAGGKYRVIRGGSQYDRAGLCRSAHRTVSPSTIRNDNLGFRLVLAIDTAKLAKRDWRATDYALKFDGKSAYVAIPSLSFDGGPMTIEARVLSEDGRQAPIVRSGGKTALSLFCHRNDYGFVVGEAKNAKWWIAPKPNEPRIQHLAAVWDGDEARLYIDGSNQGHSEVKDVEGTTIIGLLIAAEEINESGAPRMCFAGLIDELRISRGARYQANYRPTRRLVPDGETLALYHFDEGRGNVLRDSSGNGRHGKVMGGAKWVQVDAPPPAVVPFDKSAAKKHQ